LPGAEESSKKSELLDPLKQEASPLYEDFMPDKETLGESSSSLQEGSLQSASREEGLPAALTKEDWIDVLAGALQKSYHLLEERKKRTLGEEESQQSEERLDSKSESSKALGNLSSAVVNSGSRQAKKPRSSSSSSSSSLAKPSQDSDQQRSKSKKPPAENVTNAAWRKKLAALQKAHQQLSGKLSALLDPAD